MTMQNEMQSHQKLNDKLMLLIFSFMTSFKNSCHSKINEPPNDHEVQESMLSNNNVTVDRKLEFSNENTDDTSRLSSVIRDLKSNVRQTKTHWERGVTWQESSKEMS